VNKVIGNIHISPGRSFQASTQQDLYDLVPYLRNDGNRHDFSHTIHHFAFQADDEFDSRNYKAAEIMRKRLNLEYNPLDGAIAKVSAKMAIFFYRGASYTHML
jgi:hypothetical protein